MTKIFRFFFIFFLFPALGFAQSLNGVYTGVLSNDSTTIRKDQSFEMALTEYNGKVYGYAYSTFIVNDTLYYIVKRVKGKVDGDLCEVEDDEVITHNFPQKPEKKVFVTYTLRRGASDSIWRLDGNWKTNLTKKYYAISGKVETKEEKDLAKSKLYEHLGDLDLQKTVVLTKPKPKETKADLAKNTVKKDAKKNTDAKTDDKKPDASIAKIDTKIPDNKNNSITQPVSNEKKDVAVTNNTSVADKKSEPVVVKTETKAPDNKTTSPLINPPIQNEKKDITSSNPAPVDKKPENNIAKTDTRVPDNKTVSAATNNPQVQNVNKDVEANKNQNEKKPDVVKTETQLTNKNTATDTANTQLKQDAKKDAIVVSPVNNNPQTNIAKTETKPQDTKTNNVVANNTVKQDDKKTTVPANSNTVAKTETKIPDNKTNNPAVNNQPKQNDIKSTPVVTTNPNEKKLVSVPVGNQPVQNNTKDMTTVVQKPQDKNAKADFEFQELKRTNRTLKPAAQLVDGRVTDPSETIYFRSDSISIALYDNGEVDGDTVSVIINDEMFIERQGLKSSAFRKTFYIPQEQSDSLLVVLYANNLGKYPPNTGLLQIKDGEEIYYVRFKADLDKNAAIVLRRKSK